jgi:hypothetical protein
MTLNISVENLHIKSLRRKRENFSLLRGTRKKSKNLFLIFSKNERFIKENFRPITIIIKNFLKCNNLFLPNFRDISESKFLLTSEMNSPLLTKGNWTTINFEDLDFYWNSKSIGA